LFRLLHLVPKNLLSHAFGQVVGARLPLGLHRTIRDAFIKAYKVDCSDAEHPVSAYETLGDFFIRKLKPGARPLDSAPLISPVDGALTQMGRFQKDGESRLTQIKGMDYRLEDLVGPGWDLKDYKDGGGWMTIYLAPYNYHRNHSPLAGTVSQASYIPGALWPVNTWSVSHIPGLFVVNERIAVEIAGRHGKAILVMVGATNVGRITLDFHADMVGNARPRSAAGVWKPAAPLPMDKGQGLGCFELGSTVILLLSASLMESVDPKLSTAIPCALRMGRGLLA
jgi:phosphatidylserine decarboxylase